MPLYAQPVRRLMQDMAAELASEPGSIFTRKQAVAWFEENYPKIRPATVAAHLIRLSTNAPSRMHYSAKPIQDDVLYQIDSSRFRRYDPDRDPEPIREKGQPGASVESDEEDVDQPEGAGEFAYERDLRNYLAKNLETLEGGLRLYEDDEGITGIEFPVGGRFIDILANDSDGGLVVIELKVSRGYDRVVGQLMRYVAWIRKNLSDNDQSVRGMIVAREISEDLRLACSLIPDVELFEYQLSLKLNRIRQVNGKYGRRK